MNNKDPIPDEDDKPHIRKVVIGPSGSGQKTLAAKIIEALANQDNPTGNREK